MPKRRRVWLGVGLALALIGAVALATQLTGMSYAGLRDALRAQGANVQENGLGSQPFLNGADRRLVVNGAGVDVFEYSTTAGASLDAARISRDGSTIGAGFGPLGGSAAMVDFIAPPHWFHAGRVIVLYVGRDSGVLAALTAPLGPPFAGG